ncbi:MAG: hypothetical protein JWL84_3378 [Rhodospirillales bacterium]|jgi:hypothetical protein|nr:hypothetical protein [Rhodospirillales bacterium]
MSRILLVLPVVALLAACSTGNVNQAEAQRQRLACADIGIDPASAAFGQCVANLSQSMWDQQMISAR